MSFKTMAITGILCDIFGLDDLPSTVSQVSVLWLHNPRLIDRTRMHPIARRAVAEYNRSRPAASDARGLIAVAFGTSWLFYSFFSFLFNSLLWKSQN